MSQTIKTIAPAGALVIGFGVVMEAAESLGHLEK